MSGAGDDDREFEDFLQHRSPLLRRMSDLDDAQPAAALDRIIVERAHRSIRPLREGQPQSPRRWALPAGLAATVVIATSLALYLGAPGRPVPVTFAPPARPAAPEQPAAPAAPAIELRERREQLAARPAPAPAPAPAAPAVAMGELNVAAKSSVADAAAPVAPPAAAPSLAARAQSAGASAPPRDPASWLGEIRRLRAEGHVVEADREWSAFRAAWPDYAVPDNAAGPPTR